MDLIERIGKIIAIPGPVQNKENDIHHKRMDRVEKSYRRIKTQVDEIRPDVDVYTLQGYEEKVKNYEVELWGIIQDLLSVEDADELEERGATLEQLLSGLSITIKRLVGGKNNTPPQNLSGVVGMTGVQLSRIDVSNFDENILNWKTFWEQLESGVHNKPHLTDSDKLTYLRDALKDSPARNIVLGLMQTSESYMVKP